MSAARKAAEEALARWDQSAARHPEGAGLAIALRTLLAEPAPPAPDAVAEAAAEIAPQLEGFCRQAETEARPPGGQQAGLDRSWACRVPPSVLKELRWYAREFRRLLAALDSRGGRG